MNSQKLNFALILLGVLTLSIYPQKNSIANRAENPSVDHHAHIWSVDAAGLNLEPLQPVINLPEELARVLRDKERFGGVNKNVLALTDLYTKDAIVLNPSAPTWLRAEKAIKWVANTTLIDRLQPIAFQMDGSSGSIAGYEMSTRDGFAEYVSNFLYILRKDSSGKWRISFETFSLNGPPVPKEITAEQLIGELDAAGITRGVVLSVAYWFGSRISPELHDEYSKVRVENDWAANQVRRYPDRLVAFCSFNPLRDYALTELDRCAKNGVFKGLKLHFGMSQVNLEDPDHVRKVRAVFARANLRRFPIILHVRADRTYSRQHVEILLNRVLSAAPDIVIQIAHLWGGEDFSESALTAYADAIRARHRATKNLYFDVAEMELVLRGESEALRKKVAGLMRRIGLHRILYGSDRPKFGNAPSREAWPIFKSTIPLRKDEFARIASNIAPYLR